MMFNNKPVLTPEEFDYSTAKIGDYVNQEVVDNAMDCLPPACYCSRCSQMGEPYSSHFCHLYQDRRRMAEQYLGVSRTLLLRRNRRARKRSCLLLSGGMDSAEFGRSLIKSPSIFFGTVSSMS